MVWKNNKLRRAYYHRNKEHIRHQQKEYYSKNKDIISQRRRNRRQDNKEETNRKQREYKKKNRKRYSEFQRIYSNKRRQKDIKFRLNERLSSAIRRSLGGKKAGRKWEILTGYTIQDLMKYLESQFDDKMNWNNYGSYWVIDHIKPKCLFSIEETKLCWALNNLQPLERKENLRKSSRYT